MINPFLPKDCLLNMPYQPPYTLWNGDYEKQTYLALINGKEVPCWPNAGEMCAIDGSGRTWKPEDGIQVRVCTVAEHLEASGIPVPDWAKDDTENDHD